MANSISTAVIGGGPLGITTVKCLAEAGFDVTGFEGRDYIGGVWKYSTDDHLSVQSSTRFNSSRYRSAFTDFPFKPEVDDYPSWQQFYEYINDYADHFDVRRKFKTGSYIDSITREGGKYILTIKQKDGTSRIEKFDKVVVANGYFTHPRHPIFKGIEKFEGPALHAIKFHDPKQYAGKNVLCIGLHATTVDVGKMLVGHAKKVYMSHRNGLIMVGRYGGDGAAFDAALTINVTKFLYFLMDWMPSLHNWLFGVLVRSTSKASFPNVPASWNFSPAPPPHITNPILADDLYPLLESGWAEPVSEVIEVTGPRSVKLKDGKVLDDIDAIVYCTGYDGSTPFLKGDLNPYPVVGAQGNFYRNLIPLHPDPEVRSSLAFVGHGGVPWPGLSQFELQSMAIAQIWSGKVQLPPLKEMQKWHSDLLEYRRKMFASNPYNSTHYVAMLPASEHIKWLDRTSGTDLLDHFGWSWKAWKFWWQDREFYNLCKSGVLSSAMWRLFETGKRPAWPEARAQIYEDNELLKKQIATRKAYLKAQEDKKIV